MSPALARIKRGVRGAISLCGGVDGAGATAERSRSVAGDWNALNHRAFPPLDCALALDEVAIAAGNAPPIASALARELGGVFVSLPAAGATPDDLVANLLDVMDRAGQLASGVRISMSDGHCDADERAELRRLLGELCASAAGFDLVLEGMA